MLQRFKLGDLISCEANTNPEGERLFGIVVGCWCWSYNTDGNNRVSKQYKIGLDPNDADRDEPGRHIGYVILDSISSRLQYPWYGSDCVLISRL